MTAGCAIVIGGTSGIGAATAMAMASTGTVVIAVSRNPARLFEVEGAREVESLLVPVAADATDAAEIERVFDLAESRYGPVRTLVHSVGHEYEIGWYQDASPDAVVEAIAGLVVAPALVLARALRSMEVHGGNIVIVSSGAANKPTPGRALYSASKIAVNRLMESLALECEARNPKTAVCAVLPGRVDTPMQRRLMTAATEAPSAFRLEPFTSSAGVHAPRDVGAAIAELTERPATELNGHVFRYRPDGWIIADR